MREATAVEVDYWNAEYRANHVGPAFQAWERPAALLDSVLRSLSDWSVRLEDVSSVSNTENLAQVRFDIRMANGLILLHLDLQGLTVTFNRFDWNATDALRKIASPALTALRTTGGVEVAGQALRIALQVRPVGRAVRDILGPLASPKVESEFGEEARAFGLSVYADRAAWVADLSVARTDAIFISIRRAFAADMEIEKITAALRQDSDRFFKFLGLTLP